MRVQNNVRTSYCLILILCVVLTYPGYVFAQEGVKEIADPNRRTIAGLLYSQRDGSQVIVYNPNICRQVGEALCMFYRMHERGHVALNHVKRKVPPKQSEPEADCWAAQNAPRESVKAAYDHFMSGGVYMSGLIPIPSPAVHGTSRQRAEKIKTCAGDNF